jgi:hypothetical protein
MSSQVDNSMRWDMILKKRKTSVPVETELYNDPVQLFSYLSSYSAYYVTG